jgi:ethanolamine ammonia-lyase small subunit
MSAMIQVANALDGGAMDRAMPTNDPVSSPSETKMDSAVAETQSVPTILAKVRARTPARILTGRPGPAYRTNTWLELRSDHAAARDAVRTELDCRQDLGAEFVAEWAIFEVKTRARTKEEFLLRPDLGRSLSEPARAEVARRCPRGADLQIAIADGLSAAAIKAQVPRLLPLLVAEARQKGWTLGQPFMIRYGRVGTLNDIGEILDPKVVVLLIGERPGLATAESLSAYMAFRPCAGHDDAVRNLISNIHARGIPSAQAAARIVQLAARMMELQTSGVAIKEEWKPEGALARPREPGSRSIE